VAVTATSTDAQTTTQTIHYTVTTAAKAATTIRPAPQVQIPGLTGVGLLHVSATLTSNSTPLTGKTVAFTSGKTKLCSAQTNTKGVAACQINVLQEVVVLLNNAYTASFAGDSNDTASTASTPAISFIRVQNQARTISGHATGQHHQTALGALAHARGHHAAQLRARVSRSSTTNTTKPEDSGLPAAHLRPGEPTDRPTRRPPHATLLESRAHARSHARSESARLKVRLKESLAGMGFEPGPTVPR
jgi:hypothetical protein